MLKPTFSIVLLIISLVGFVCSSCAQTPIEESNQTEQPVNDRRNENPSEVKRLLNPEGWVVPIPRNHVVFKKRYHIATSGNLKIYATWLRGSLKLDSNSRVNGRFLSEADMRILGFGSNTLVVTDVKVFDISQQPFAYVVLVHPEGIPATLQLIYYDENGDGLFEVVETGMLESVPRIPEWIFEKFSSDY